MFSGKQQFATIAFCKLVSVATLQHISKLLQKVIVAIFDHIVAKPNATKTRFSCSVNIQIRLFILPSALIKQIAIFRHLHTYEHSFLSVPCSSFRPHDIWYTLACQALVPLSLEHHLGSKQLKDLLRKMIKIGICWGVLLFQMSSLDIWTFYNLPLDIVFCFVLVHALFDCDSFFPFQCSFF